MINKLKELWNKMKYWQRGAVFGLLFGMFFFFLSNYRNLMMVFQLIYFFHFIPNLCLALILKTNIDDVSLLSFFLIILWYGLLGMIFGVIVKHFRMKFTKYNSLFFLLGILLYFGLIFLINYLALILFFAYFGFY